MKKKTIITSCTLALFISGVFAETVNKATTWDADHQVEDKSLGANTFLDGNQDRIQNNANVRFDYGTESYTSKGKLVLSNNNTGGTFRIVSGTFIVGADFEMRNGGSESDRKANLYVNSGATFGTVGDFLMNGTGIGACTVTVTDGTVNVGANLLLSATTGTNAFSLSSKAVLDVTGGITVGISGATNVSNNTFTLYGGTSVSANSLALSKGTLLFDMDTDGWNTANALITLDTTLSFETSSLISILGYNAIGIDLTNDFIVLFRAAEQFTLEDSLFSFAGFSGTNFMSYLNWQDVGEYSYLVFGTGVVPEPSEVAAVLGLMALGFAAYRRKR